MIDGMPDPKIHRICRRCQQWFYPEEGTFRPPEVAGPLSGMQALRAEITGDPALFRFECKRCTKVRRMRERIVWGTLFGLIALILILERVGFLR